MSSGLETGNECILVGPRDSRPSAELDGPGEGAADTDDLLANRDAEALGAPFRAADGEGSQMAAVLAIVDGDEGGRSSHPEFAPTEVHRPVKDPC